MIRAISWKRSRGAAVSDMRENIDCGTVVNLIKSVYAMREHRNTFAEVSPEHSIGTVLRLPEMLVYSPDTQMTSQLLRK